MSMSKKDFIALADTIREHNRLAGLDHTSKLPGFEPFRKAQVSALADFCQSQNPRFMRDRWLAYIAGECGPNGGGVKEPKSWAVQGNYGQGWETVCTEDNRKEALERLREYRENETQYSHRLVRE